MHSYWEKESYLKHDVVIVGGGILGLSTACSIKESSPEKTVTILERGLLPTGASTRNAGFACFGSVTELLSDMETLGEAKMLELVSARWEGLQMLRQRLGDEAIGYEAFGGYELITEKELLAIKNIPMLNDLLRPIFHSDVFQVMNDRIEEFNFSPKYVKAMIFNPFEGQIDTGKMMKTLTSYAASLGVTYITGAEVTAVTKFEDKINVTISNKTLFTATKVAVCTNAFLPNLLPKLKIQPGRGQVLITKEIPDLPFLGIFHYDEGFYYFRNVGKRVLFGGGRNLDFIGEQTTTFETNEKILNNLLEKLKNIILPNMEFEIDYNWQGIMAFGENKFPQIIEHKPNIFSAIGCNGMGIALSSKLGKELSEKLG